LEYQNNFTIEMKEMVLHSGLVGRCESSRICKASDEM